MSTDDLDSALRSELRRIAPDVDVDDIDRDADIREEMDIDSMDFLNLVTALSKRFSMPIPEADYAELASYAGILAYLSKKTV